MSETNIDISSRPSRTTIPLRKTFSRPKSIYPVQHPDAHADPAETNAASLRQPQQPSEQLPDNIPDIAAIPPGRRPYRAFGKRALDLTLVTLAAPFALPLIAGAAFFLWREGNTPFFRQERLGYGGTVFSIVKLRTMLPDSDHLLEDKLAADPALRAEWDTTQKLKDDPRITRIGAFLRKTSLDELPQLWNVLKGEMSLVGPRPMLCEQLPLYGDPTHYQALRPGITGYWQVSARNGSAFRARVALDAAYNRDLSLLEDAKILWRTIGAVLKRTGY